LSGVANGGDVYTSNNYGANGSWTDQTSSGSMHNLNYTTVTTDSSGEYMSTAVMNGDIYYSSNYGTTWTDQTPSGSTHNQPYYAMASNNTGQYMVVVAQGGDTFTGENESLAPVTTAAAVVTTPNTGDGQPNSISPIVYGLVTVALVSIAGGLYKIYKSNSAKA
jgi:hypothetical protein